MTKKNLPADLALPALRSLGVGVAIVDATTLHVICAIETFDFEGLSQLASTLIETAALSGEKA